MKDHHAEVDVMRLARGLPSPGDVSMQVMVCVNLDNAVLVRPDFEHGTTGVIGENRIP